MRIHTTLETDDFYAAARLAHVTFDRFERHSSRTHDHAFDVILEGSSGRHKNSGAYGAMTDSEAASWDEWGIFLGHLFRLDANIKAGWAYADAIDFHDVTDNRFYYGDGDVINTSGLLWEDQHRHHRWVYVDRDVTQCRLDECTATRSPSRRVSSAV